MTEPGAIIRAGVEDLFPLVIFAAIIIAQIIKKARQAQGGGASSVTRPRPRPQPHSPPRPPKPPVRQASPPASAGSGDDELRRFLEELTGAQQPRPKPPPSPPTPPPVRVVSRRPQGAAQAAVARVKEAKPKPVVKPSAPTVWDNVHEDVHGNVHGDVHKGVHGGVHQGVHQGVHEGVHGRRKRTKPPRMPDSDREPGSAASVLTLRKGLQSRTALRDAILLREVLGPPLALRAGELPRK